MEYGESPQLKAFVVITLPPSDNPSFGKTISTFTISDSSSSPIPTQEQESHQTPQNPQLILPVQRRFQLGAPKASLGLLGISLFALILWVCSSPQTLFQTRNIEDQRFRDGEDDDEGKPNAFIFPLYPKLGMRELLQKDIELKLGRFVEFDSDNIVSPFSDDGVRASKIKKAVSAVDSTAILPVKGGIYLDGSVQDVKQFFKPLTFKFGSKWLTVSVKLRIPPEGYLVISNKGNVCLGILDGSEVHDGSTIILGDVSLRGQLVVYDNVNQHIG